MLKDSLYQIPRFAHLAAGLVIVLLVLINGPVHAAGFYLTEVGTPGSLGTAGTANPTNNQGADSAWTNPAGMTGIDREQVAVGGLTLILPKIEFDPSQNTTAPGDDGGNAGMIAGVPSFFYVNKLSDRSRFGFSVVAPIGGGVDYGNNFVGRYQTISAELAGIGFSPSYAYQVNDQLSLGAGVSFVYTLFEQDIAINNRLGRPDGKVQIEEADGWGYQPFFGLTYEFSDDALLGVVYRAEAETDLDGDVKFKNWQLLPVTPRANKVDIEWDNPQWLDVGFRYKLSDKDTLFLNAGWQDWSEFSDNRLALSGGVLNPVINLDRNFEDTWYAGVAYTHKLNDQQAILLGTSYDSSPVEDEDRTFDLPFDEAYKFSAAYLWERHENLHASIGATLMVIGDASIDQTAQGFRVDGEFDDNLLLFVGGTLRYRF